MKNYNITVNGVTYQVTVEEAGAVAAAPNLPAPSPSVPAPAAASPVKAAPASKNVVKADVPGKITKISVKEGQAVKSGDTVLMLEAMKMEIPVVSSSDGTVTAVLVSVGQSVDSGEALVALD